MATHSPIRSRGRQRVQRGVRAMEAPAQPAPLLPRAEPPLPAPQPAPQSQSLPSAPPVEPTVVTPFSVSISQLSKRMDFVCDRHLRRYFAVKADLDRERLIKRDATAPPPVTEASRTTAGHMQRGVRFEATVGEWLRARAAPGAFIDLTRTELSLARIVDDAAALLANEAVEAVYLWQCPLHVELAALIDDPALSAQLRTLLRPALLLPDLLVLERCAGAGGVACTVVDVKSSAQAKPSHQLQVATYALALARLPPTRLWRLERGEVWLPSAAHDLTRLAPAGPRREAFALPPLFPYALRALDRLPALITPPRVQWTLSARCAECEFLGGCRGEAEAADSVERLCGLSRGDRQVLRRMLARRPAADAASPALPDMEELATHYARYATHLTQEPRLQRILAHDAATGRSLLVHATRTQRAVARPTPTCLLSRQRPATLVCVWLEWNAEADALADIYVLSPKGVWRAAASPPVASDVVAHFDALVTDLDNARAPGVQFVVASAEQQRHLLQFLVRMCLEGAQADQMRAARALVALADDPFCYGVLPRDDLRGTAQPAATSWRVARLRELIEYVTGAPPDARKRKEELLSEAQALQKTCREALVSAPPRLLVLTDAARLLLALPFTGIATDAQVNALLLGANAKSDELPKVEILPLLYDGLRSLIPPDQLLGSIPPFRLWVNLRLTDRTLRSLLFVRQHELYTEVRRLRDERLRQSRAIRVRVTDAHAAGGPNAVVVDGFELLRSGDGDEGGVGAYLCYPAERPEAALAFVDQQHAARPGAYVPHDELPPGAALVDLVCFAPADAARPLAVRLASERRVALVPNAEYLVRPRCVDFLLAKVAAVLTELDALPADRNALLRLLRRPTARLRFAAPPPEAYGSSAAATLYLRLLDLAFFNQLPAESPRRELGLSRSQRQAYFHAMEQRVQLVWGPPGTGKTAYLSRLLLRWVQARIALNAPFRVLVTAFTKTAIRNLISAIWEVYQIWTSNPDKATDDVPDVSGWPAFDELVAYVSTDFEPERAATDAPCKAVRLPKETGESPLSGIVQIVCGTVHQLYKLRAAYEGAQAAELLVIDEASQMLVADAAIPISMIDPDRGRLILAGDHLQLPPLLHGEYPTVAYGEADCTGSVMQAFMHAAVGTNALSFLEVEGATDNKPVRVIALQDIAVGARRVARGTELFVSDVDGTDVHVYQGHNRSDTFVVPANALQFRVCPILVQLAENRRSNAEIGRFVGGLYCKSYECQSPGLRLDVRDGSPVDGALLGPVLRSHAAKAPHPFALLLVEVATAAMLEPLQERALEAAIVQRLVSEVRAACPADRCFVPTPHRAQRFYIARRLGTLLTDTVHPRRRGGRGAAGGAAVAAVQVDTVDRMQGQQAECVVLSALLTDPDVIAAEADFLFNLQRLNVAMSRAACLCIVLASSALLAPDPHVLRGRQSRAGFERLVAFAAATRAHLRLTVAHAPDGAASAEAEWLRLGDRDRPPRAVVPLDVTLATPVVPPSPTPAAMDRAHSSPAAFASPAKRLVEATIALSADKTHFELRLRRGWEQRWLDECLKPGLTLPGVGRVYRWQPADKVWLVHNTPDAAAAIRSLRDFAFTATDEAAALLAAPTLP